MRMCKLCGKPLPKGSQAKYHKECREEGMRLARSGQARTCARPELVINGRVYPACEKLFKPVNNKQIYCGEECRELVKWYTRKKRIYDIKEQRRLDQLDTFMEVEKSPNELLERSNLVNPFDRTQIEDTNFSRDFIFDVNGSK